MTALDGGFATPATQSAEAFRAIMTAMAMPARCRRWPAQRPPAPLSVAAGAALLTLCDADTPLHLAGPCDTDEVRAWIAFHTGAPLSGPEHCAFAVGPWEALQPLNRFPIGTPDYPDRSATLIVEMDRLEARGATLTGPGIRDSAQLSLPDTRALVDNHALFPLGLDLLFTHGDRIAALPRSTRVQQRETA